MESIQKHLRDTLDNLGDMFPDVSIIDSIKEVHVKFDCVLNKCGDGYTHLPNIHIVFKD